ncbi:hypothetical protein DY000_02037826 [Brassica cretica]|uniref:ER membrane protein complex subunit 3 n=1 Tax=Brassica cretica TaxID=69181 RepID=A0ABQ7BD31_BRACR|nr:hypothetical protein DY000_02037826 [Brassica cretica]
MAEDLVLDTAIRDWVLIPLSVVMVLIGVLRYFVSKLMRSSPTPDAKMVKEGQVVIRARNLKAGANFIPPKSFRARRFYFSNEENGLLHVPKDQAQNPQAQMFSDPNMAMDMMKKNLSMIIPQTLTFAWVNFFFSGFVAAKIPFPLTQRFRSMLQNGIDLSTVDVSYVSSRSWYFLNLFGLRGLFSLILGDENAIDDTQRMMQMGGFGFDASKVNQAWDKIIRTASHLHLTKPFKYSPPEPRVADDGIPTPCCGGGGDHVVATSEMSDFQRQLRELKDEGHVNASKLDMLERTVGELSKKEVEVIHGFALEVYVMVYGLVLISSWQSLKGLQGPSLTFRVYSDTDHSLSMENTSSYVNLLNSQSSVDLESPEPF